MILENMTGLKKIYIQSPNAIQAKKIISNLYYLHIHPEMIEDVGYINQFYIPNEWIIQQ
jgi:hypothetical protein